LKVEKQSHSGGVRRQKSYCSFCLSPQVTSAADDTASSYGLGASSDDAAAQNNMGTTCTGVTTQPADTAYGDYLEIANLQPTIGTAGTLSESRICGTLFNAITGNAQTLQATACSFSAPFRIGVHFDEGESLVDTKVATDERTKGENVLSTDLTTGQGYGYSGFWFAYWQNSC